MIKSKAIDIIKTFNPEEFKEFGKFVRSPYFNENGKVVELFGLLKKYYPDFSNRNFTKDNLYAKLFAGRKYNDGTMRKLLSEMQSLAEEYLAHSNFDKKWYFRKTLALLYQLDEKKLDNLFEMNMKELNNIYKKYENFEDDYFKANFEIEVASLNFRYSKGRGGMELKQALGDHLRCAAYLLCYSMITIFKLGQDIMSDSTGLDFDYKNTIVYRFIENLGAEKFLEIFRLYIPEFSPVIEIYFCRFMTAAGLDEDDRYYWRLKELVFENLPKFTRFEQYNLMLFLEASCLQKNISGKDFKRELNNIYRVMLPSGLYTSEDKDYFSLVRFRHIVRNALSIGEVKWAEECVNGYLNKLPPEFRDNMLHYSHALLDFKAGRYDKALENISKVKFEFHTLKFDSWSLKLQTEFELNYYEEALYSLDSYHHSLKKDTTSPQWLKTRFSNFMNYYQKIFKVKYSVEKIHETEKEFLRDEISKTSELLEKEWLMDKMQDFIP